MNEVSAAERSLPVWPPGQAVRPWLEPTVFVARFADHAAYHDRLRATILRLAEDPAAANPTEGGTIGSVKIYDVDKWGCPAAALVHGRAVELFRLVTRRREAVVDLSWASLYRSGDWCMPHSHPRTLASVLYALDLGETDDPANGQFCFADPRMKVCCGEQPGYMSTPCAPRLEPGMMMMFPGQTVHFVNPYRGERPRITLSWNINFAPLPGEPVPYAVNRFS
jgi:hypothetical protein